MSADEIAREFAHLTLAQVYAALAYYFDNRELVRSHIKEDDHYAESMRLSVKRHNALGNAKSHGCRWESSFILMRACPEPSHAD